MEQIKIDLVPNGVMSVAHASQFDVGRSMKFLLTDEGVTYTLAGTEVITMKLRKPDGTDDTISLANTSSSYVEWTTVDGDLDLSGVYLAEITITSGADVLGTANFLLKVEADPYNGKNIRIVTVGPADICTFETGLPEPYQSVTVNVLATGGNGTPDNPNPINGYSSANITRCGVNFLPFENYSHTGIINDMGTVATNNSRLYTPKVSLNSNETYTLKIVGNSSANQPIYCNRIIKYGHDGSFLRRLYISTSQTQTFTIESDVASVVFDLKDSLNTDISMSDITSINLSVGSSALPYAPYNGQTYTIAFGQTVYGGVLDVTRGKLEIDFANDRLDTKTWSYNSSRGAFNATFSDKDQTRYNEMICSCYANGGFVYSASEVASKPDKAFYTQNNSNTIFIKDSDYTDTTTWLNALGSNTICYPLATPFNIDLTPVQIRALVGENNVFADCGQTEVEYLAEV